MTQTNNVNLFDDIQSICRDYRKHLKRGEVKPIEGFLEQIDEGSRGILFQNLLHLDTEFRRRRGENPCSDDYVSRFPTYAKLVRQAFFESTMLSHESRVDTPDDNDLTVTLGVPAARKLGDYELLGELGRGGFGVVYEARHLQRGERVALKTLPNISAGSSLSARDAERLHEFRREFRSLAECNHPNLVGMQTLEFDGNQWFFTMDLVDGVDFLEYTRPQGQVDELRLRSAAKQLVRGVAALHDQGIVHRDLKPSNVMVDSTGRVTILDFGLAAELQHATDHTLSAQTRGFAGTPRYAAPEQLDGTRSEATDWYAIGVMIFEALAGASPHTGSGVDLLVKKKTEDAPPLHGREHLPEDLAQLVDGLLQRDPKQRPDHLAIAKVLDVESESRGQDSTDSETSASARDADAPLIGRETQLRSIAEAYGQVRDEGNPFVLFVGGLSGEGKTTLVETFLDKIRRDAVTAVLQGRCYDRESVPFKVIDSLVDALAVLLRSRSGEELGKWMPDDIDLLSHLFPVLRRVPFIEHRLSRDISGIDDREIRYRAFFALKQALVHLSRQAPLVLFVDDLQWGDGDSAEVLFELLSPPNPPGVLFLGTYRSDEAAESPFLTDWGRMSDDRPETVSQTRLSVQPLTKQQCVELVATRIGIDDAQLMARGDELFADTQGNPYFVEQLIESFDASTGRFQPVPLDELVERKLQRLPEQAADLLQTVAVAGQAVSIAEAAEVCRGIDNAFSIITRMRSEKLVRLIGSHEMHQVDTYHDKVRETVLGRLGDERRRGLHQRFADVISGQASGTDAESDDAEVHLERVFDLAHHYFEASDPLAFEYQLLAGHTALEAYAMENALAHFRRAEQIAPGDIDRSTRCRFKIMYANAQAGCELHTEAIDNYRQALEMTGEKEDRATCYFALGELYWIQSEYSEGLKCFRQSFAALGERLPRTTAGKLVATMAGLMSFHLRPRWMSIRLRKKTASELAMLAERYARMHWLVIQLDIPLYLFAVARSCVVAKQTEDAEDRDAEVKSEAYSTYASLLAFTGAGWLAPLVMARAKKYYQKVPDKMRSGQVDSDIGLYSYCLGQLSDAEKDFRVASERMARSGHYVASYADHFLWHLWSVRGDAQRLLQHARNEEVIAKRSNDRVILAYSWYGQAEGLALCGETGEAIRLVNSAVSELSAVNGSFLYLAYVQKARVEIQIGDYEAARNSLVRALKDMPRLRLVEITAYAFPLLVEAILADRWINREHQVSWSDRWKAGRAVLAGRLCGLVFPNIRPNVLRTAGRLHAAKGNTNKAMKCFGKSIDAAKKHGAEYIRARSLLDLAAIKDEARDENRREAIALLRQLHCVIPCAEGWMLGDQYDPAVVAQKTEVGSAQR